ncbi:HlyD family efflux transporter periplasmic adaptor subunit [Fundidesulfovibrio butyratiphilus]
MSQSLSRRLVFVVVVLACAVGGYFAWTVLHPRQDPGAFAVGNGRIEATEVDISTKMAGRLVSVLAREGDDVTAGEPLARMDTKVLDADLREAEAAIMQAEHKKAGAVAAVAQRQNEILAAEALVAQRSSQLQLSDIELRRTQKLHTDGVVPRERLDVDLTTSKTNTAQLKAAQAQVFSARAGLESAKAGVLEAQAAIEAARAKAETIRADLSDATLISPINGRVLYRLAEPGEILGVGGRVLTLLDLSDVYMTLFLPTAQVGRAALGAEARIVLDVRPDISIPAKVTFVSPQAQFTPKAVETRTEREKLMFRIKVHIAPDLLRAHAKQVKTGLPGVAYVRLDSNAPWPREVPPLVGETRSAP